MSCLSWNLLQLRKFQFLMSHGVCLWEGVGSASAGLCNWGLSVPNDRQQHVFIFRCMYTT